MVNKGNRENIAPPRIKIVYQWKSNLDRRTARAVSHTFTRIAPNPLPSNQTKSTRTR